MQTSPLRQSPHLYQPAFCGLTNVFQKRIIEKPSVYYELTNYIQDEFIGSLPPEIIRLIKNVTHSHEEKVAAIKKIMGAFGQVANILKKSNIEYSEKNTNYIKYSPRTIFLNIGNKIQCLKAQKLLTKTFQDANIIGKKDKIKISSFENNAGSFGIVYNIDFPQNSNISKKVIKVYKPMSEVLQRHAHHGILPESNSAQFIAKQERHNFKNSCFIQPYFSSVKDSYMLAEHASSYPVFNNVYKHDYEKMHIWINDWRTSNISNMRIVDFGDITPQKIFLTKGSKKPYKKLIQAYKAALHSDMPQHSKEFIDLLIKYKTATQKELKINPLDARIAVNNFLGNKYALSDNMMYFLRRNHFVIRNNQLIQIPKSHRIEF